MLENVDKPDKQCYTHGKLNNCESIEARNASVPPHHRDGYPGEGKGQSAEAVEFARNFTAGSSEKICRTVT